MRFRRCAVRAADGRLYSAHEYAATLAGAPSRALDEQIEPRPGDRFLMLSDSWNAFDELAPLFARIREQGGEIISCVFDLIPELHPHACHDVTVPLYDAWLRKALVESDGFLAISRTVAEELAAFVENRALPHRSGLKIGWFHCGCDIAPAAALEPRAKIRDAAVGPSPLFLCVSTIEPRKGQRVALRAFESLWREGVDARLLFVGRRGWLDEAVVAEIANHPERGAGCSGSRMSGTTNSPSFTNAPARSFCPPSRKVLACPSWRRLGAAARFCAAISLFFAKSAAPARSIFASTTRGRWRIA